LNWNDVDWKIGTARAWLSLSSCEGTRARGARAQKFFGDASIRMSERDVRNRRAGARLVAVVERDGREALLALLAVVARVVRGERRLRRTTEERHLDFGGPDEVSAFDVSK